MITRFVLVSIIWTGLITGQALGGAENSSDLIDPGKDPVGAFDEFLARYLDQYQPLVTAASRAWWEANTTGSDEAFARKKQADQALIELHSDRESFARLRVIRESGKIVEPVAARQLDVIYRA